MISAIRRVTLISLGAALVACGGRSVPPHADAPGHLLMRVVDGRIHAADTIPHGWTQLRIEEDGDGHLVVGYRLAPDADDNLAEFLVALDTARASPVSTRAIGGAEVGDTSEVVVDLTPGRYVFACVRRAENGKRHAALGELHLLVVLADSTAVTAIPTATLDLPMHDFAFGGAQEWAAGAHLLRVTNHGLQDHQLRLARLEPGVTLRAWLDAPDDIRVDSTVAGVARISHLGTAFLPLQLAAGRYIAYCLVPDPVSDKPHVELGMMREFIVR